MKFTIAMLLNVAKQRGYTGSEVDEKAIRSFLSDEITLRGLKWSIKDKATGAVSDVTARMLVVQQPDASTVIVTEDAGEVAADPSAENSMRNLIRSEIERGLTAAGTINRSGKAPGEVVPDVSVRGPDEIMYDLAISNGRKVFRSFEAAKSYHSMILANLGRQSTSAVAPATTKKATDWLVNRGIIDKDTLTLRTTGSNATFPQAAGGALTGIEFVADIIKNINLYGDSTKYARQHVMADQKAFIPKHSGAYLTVSYTDENATGTSQRNDWSNVTLDAKSGKLYTRMSREVLQDSRIDIAMQTAEDYSIAFARQEENALHIGDGTTTYGGMLGINTQFTSSGNLGLTLATAAGAVSGGTTTLNHTITNLEDVIARLPSYARNNAKWYCSPETQSRVFDRLGLVQGGVTLRETLTDGGYVKTFLGFPIITSNAMNSTNEAGADKIDILFGDLSRAAVVGRRLDPEIMSSEQVGFLENAIWMRGILRHDIVVHDLGTTTARGPIIALYQTA
jgi:HK97 family phage major capsid protein